MHSARASHRPWPASFTAIVYLASLLVVACAHRHSTGGLVTSSSAGDVAASATTHWTAALTPITGLTSGVQGRADISIAAIGQPATVVLFLTGLQPGHAYTWHIRRGPCSAAEPLGPPSDYAPLTVDSAGRGTATGTFPLTDPALSAYHIGIHPAGAAPIACGTIAAKH